MCWSKACVDVRSCSCVCACGHATVCLQYKHMHKIIKHFTHFNTVFVIYRESVIKYK